MCHSTVRCRRRGSGLGSRDSRAVVPARAEHRHDAIAQLVRSEIKVPQFGAIWDRSGCRPQCRSLGPADVVVMVDGHQDVAHRAARTLGRGRLGSDRRVEPSRIVLIGALQLIGDETEQHHVRLHRGRVGLLVAVVRQAHRAVDVRAGPHGVAVVESPDRLDQKVRGRLLTRDAERLQCAAGRDFEVAERRVRAISEVAVEFA